jgi:hypothetical protein
MNLLEAVLSKLSSEELARLVIEAKAEQRRRDIDRLGENEVHMREGEPFYP